MLRRAFYWPRDFLVAHTTARDRGAFGAWTVIVAAALTPVLGREVLYVTILSVVALIPNITAETPVEEEEADG